VTSIEGFSETLLNGAKNDPDKLDHFLDIIHSESVRLSELIQDILSLSKVKKDNNKADMVNLQEDIEHILDQQSLSIKKHNLTIKKEFTGNQGFLSVDLNHDKHHRVAFV